MLVSLFIMSACSLAPTVAPDTDLPPTASSPPPPESTDSIETPLQPQAPAPETTFDVFLPEVSAPEETSQEIQPPATSPPPAAPDATLAFLKEGDLWLVGVPGGVPQQLTQSADLFSFAWSPDGQRLATFNGRNLCFLNLDGSSAEDCIELGLDESQAQVERRLVWSPDQNVIVLWNPVNPWDEGAIGWLVVDLSNKLVQFRIDDPVDWGVGLAPDNDPGGITGQPVFLPNGALIGTITHRWLCGSGGCHFQLYQFDPLARSFSPYPNKPDEGWSEGQGLVLSSDSRLLANFGTFHAGCDSYVTFVDLFDLNNQTRQTYNLDMEAISAMDLSPDGSLAIISRVAGCASEETTQWDRACGLSTGFDVFSMQLWDFTADQRLDLVPGTSPDWSKNGNWIAFRSCLSGNSDGNWEPSPSGPPAIYVMDRTATTVIPISQGSTPAWKP